VQKLAAKLKVMSEEMDRLKQENLRLCSEKNKSCTSPVGFNAGNDTTGEATQVKTEEQLQEMDNILDQSKAAAGSRGCAVRFAFEHSEWSM
jgi:hypothetical protein